MIGNSGVIGDYELRGHLGGGGQGCVYYAVNWLTGEECALKIYHDDFDERRVVREASSLKGRNIPCFPRILDSGSVNLEGRDRLYVAFEFIEGVTLESRLIRGTLDEKDAMSLGISIASCIDALWHHRIVHRDIKPKNIMIDSEGSFVLIDLGCAQHQDLERITETGFTLGTPGYMSPEQALGRSALTVKSDVFALGIVMYESITGCHPYEASQRNILLESFRVDISGLSRFEHFRGLIPRMLHPTPILRPLPSQVIDELKGGD